MITLINIQLSAAWNIIDTQSSGRTVICRLLKKKIKMGKCGHSCRLKLVNCWRKCWNFWEISRNIFYSLAQLFAKVGQNNSTTPRRPWRNKIESRQFSLYLLYSYIRYVLMKKISWGKVGESIIKLSIDKIYDCHNENCF